MNFFTENGIRKYISIGSFKDYSGD
jgi:hypothetical protein